MVMTMKTPLAVALLLGAGEAEFTDAELGRLTRWLFGCGDDDIPVTPFCEEAEDANPELVAAVKRRQALAATDLAEVRDSIAAEIRKAVARLSSLERDAVDEQVERLQRDARAVLDPDAVVEEARELAVSLADIDEDADEEGAE